MDFDFNIILVPATLILGFIWLIDKLWLKQRGHARSKQDRALKDTQEVLEQKKQAYKDALSNHNIVYDDYDKVNLDDVPVAVKKAHHDYRDARRLANVEITKQQIVKNGKHQHFLIRWAHDYFPVLAVVLIVRSFIIEPFNIPSSSMVPTLYTGDFVVVNKYAYGIRLPLFYNKIIDSGSPKHGDVAVFRFPENPKIYYIKRVIGLPGDTVSFQNGQLSVNGKPIPSKQIEFDASTVLTDQLYTPVESANPSKNLSPEQAVSIGQNEESGAKYFKEQLGEHDYTRRYLVPSLQVGEYSEFLEKQITHASNWQVKVPEGNYFVMGDNSDRSKDSRFWGYVPDENLAGKAVYVWMHKKPGLSNLPTFKYNRSID